MKQADEITQIINECETIFKDLTEEEWAAKRNINNWSKKEI